MPEHLVVGEGFVDPLGFHDATPTFSWKLPAGTKSQTSYQIEVRDLSGEKTIWDSEWVDSDRSVFVPYGGQPLTSRQQLIWRVRFRDESGRESDWSSSARFEMGLLSSDDWKAQWIRPAGEADPEEESVACLRREFSVSEKVGHARLYVTARGLYEVYLNGGKVGKDVFTPGWTSYANRIDTQTYEVTAAPKAYGRRDRPAII